MTDKDELEDLEALIVCPGYKRMRSKFDSEWGRAGQRYCDALEKMANTTDAEEAAKQMQMVIWVRKEMEQFFHSVEGRVAQLRAMQQPPAYNPSRRGTL